MEFKIGLMMDLPDGKIPGFYAQIVKALAGKVELFDRDKEMLIVSNEEQQRAALEVMAHFNIETTIMDLRLLGDDAELTDLFSDYGFTSRAEHNYLYDKIVIPFRFTAIVQLSRSIKQLSKLKSISSRNTRTEITMCMLLIGSSRN